MALHRFSVAQKVSFQPGAADLRQLRGSYTVVRALPSETRDQQYRVKSDQDGHERVVLESQLALPQAGPSAWDPWSAKVKTS
jgi:hypothetical protein